MASIGEPVHTCLDTIEEGPEQEVAHASGPGSVAAGEHGGGFGDETQAGCAGASVQDLDPQGLFPWRERSRALAKLTARH